MLRSLPLTSSLLLLTLSVLLPPSVVRADNSDASEWTSLFNGESLDGWARHSGEATFEVKDGMIVGTAVPNTGNSFLCTAGEYGDFVFECEFQVDQGLNSGVQFRSQFFDKATEIDLGEGKTRTVPADRVHGYQCEIDCADKPRRMWTGGIYDEGRRGWLFPGPKGGDDDRFTEDGIRVIDADGWNTFRIECR
ncbi:MAG: DUF1080 domain-containing protein, partial [Planctomycetaceae bacterium]|nr:DUF1080 domain-containing protein [Planctomycetaceae bacterium]